MIISWSFMHLIKSWHIIYSVVEPEVAELQAEAIPEVVSPDPEPAPEETNSELAQGKPQCIPRL